MKIEKFVFLDRLISDLNIMDKINHIALYF